MRMIVLSFCLGIGCGGQDPFTWGDASQQIGVVFCSAIDRCGISDDISICEEHVAWHLCKPDHTCDVEVPEGRFNAALSACDTALSMWDTPNECYALLWGVLPAECASIWEIQPDAQ